MDPMRPMRRGGMSTESRHEIMDFYGVLGGENKSLDIVREKYVDGIGVRGCFCCISTLEGWRLGVFCCLTSAAEFADPKKSHCLLNEMELKLSDPLLESTYTRSKTRRVSSLVSMAGWKSFMQRIRVYG
jgi:hypothetical protein